MPFFFPQNQGCEDNLELRSRPGAKIVFASGQKRSCAALQQKDDIPLRDAMIAKRLDSRTAEHISKCWCSVPEPKVTINHEKTSVRAHAVSACCDVSLLKLLKLQLNGLIRPLLIPPDGVGLRVFKVGLLRGGGGFIKDTV